MKTLKVVTLLLLLIWGCSQDNNPVEPKPEDTANLSFNMGLEPAILQGYNVTKVSVHISKSAFADSMDLVISGTSASGTFTDLTIGIYSIAVKVYEDTTLIATGSGTGEVIANQTNTATINISFLTGDLTINVNWGNTSFGGIIFGDFGITDSTYDYNSDWDAICDSIFGSAYRVADWTDLENYYSGGGDLLALYDGLGRSDYRNSVYLKRNGSQFYTSTRAYLAERHEHLLPSGWLAHDHIDNYLISLGSWYGSNYILVYKI